MTSAGEQLIAYAKTADPFRNAPENLAELQLEAVRERFSERRGQIKVLDKRAKETGVDEITSLDDVVPLLFAHTNYKSYPEDRKSVVSGKSVSVRVVYGGRRIIKKKKEN